MPPKDTAARMITIRTTMETGSVTGKELLSWYISDPGEIGTFIIPMQMYQGKYKTQCMI